RREHSVLKQIRNRKENPRNQKSHGICCKRIRLYDGCTTTRSNAGLPTTIGKYGIKLPLNMRIRFVLFLSLIAPLFQATAQSPSITDSLRGGITPERAWWDLKHYTLKIHIDPE